jgi:serine/threonine protein kinase
VTDQFRYRAARQAIKAVAVIHRKQVIHSDLSARQFLVDKSLNLRLSDFGGSSLHGSEALVMEKATHFLPRDEDAPNTVQSDIFALGSTIYEILLGERPYGERTDDEIQTLYRQKAFPNLESIKDERWRRVIQKCWAGEYSTTADVLEASDLTYIRQCVRLIFVTILYTCCPRGKESVFPTTNSADEVLPGT